MSGRQVSREYEFKQDRTIQLRNAPTQPRRCLGCDEWMHSTGADHRLCNPCADKDAWRGSNVGERLHQVGPRRKVQG